MGIFFALAIIFVLLIFSMMITVVCFEKDCKKIIFWNLVIVLTSIFGFAVYLIWFCDKPSIKKSKQNKFNEDKIYKELSNFKLESTTSKNDFFNFNKRNYEADIFNHSRVEVIDLHERFSSSVASDIDKSANYIIIVTKKFLNGLNNENIVSLLKEKQNIGVDVKCIYTKATRKDRTVIKSLKNSGVKVCKFTKNNLNKYYKNAKNIVDIDGKISYIFNYISVKPKQNIVCSNLFFRLSGDVLKGIDIDCHQDASYASRKYCEMEHKEYQNSGDMEVQYLTSVADKDFEGVFVKAINDAKKKIVVYANKFIPTPSINQALRMAIMSGVEVKIILSKGGYSMDYYSSRAYIKEMAQCGATGYIYDGYFKSNFVLIDNLSIVGNFSLVNLEIRNNLQNMLVINNEEISDILNDYFLKQVNDSYRICKPKNELLREKIFKKFN